MKSRSRKEVKKFVEAQKVQLGLDDAEAQDLFQQAVQDIEEDDSDDLALEADVSDTEQMNLKMDIGEKAMASSVKIPGQVSAKDKPSVISGMKRKKARRKAMSDPYLSESQTIKARPSRISRIRSFLFEHAMPNEYVMQIGVKDAKAVLGGKFFKIGKRFLKFPATVQTVYFTSDNANKDYQGLRIDGYACWRIDPENPEVAARTLDFSDQDNPMGNTNRILRTICTEAIRHLIANTTITDALTKKDEIGRDLKAQLERIERSWGITFDQVGIERVTILSSEVFNDLQQKTRDALRLDASESRMETDQKIEKKKAEHTRETETLRCHTEKETRILRATSASEIHKVELEENVARESDKQKALEAKSTAEKEAADRAADQEAEHLKRQAAREAEVEMHKESEQRKLKMARMASEAKVRASEAEIKARMAEAQARSEMAISEAEHKKQLKQQALGFERNFQAMENDQRLERERLSAKLEMAADRFGQTLRERQDEAELEHEAAMKRMKLMKLEEDMRNLVSENRIMAEFVDRLPEIAASLEIDRYTVLDASGTSPLTNSLAQMLSLLDEHGLRRFFGEKKETGKS